MTSELARIPPRAFTGKIIDTPPTSGRGDSAYREIANANDHLHKVVNALLKERSGQPLTDAEQNLIGLCIAAKHWQLQHGNKDAS